MKRKRLKPNKLKFHNPSLLDELPSVEDARAALSSKKTCEEVFGPLRRDDLIDYFKQSVEIGISEETKAATISRDLEIVLEQAVAVPIWMLAQAAVLLKTAPPGRKQSMSARKQLIRYAAGRHYVRMKQKLGSADAAASHVSDWLRSRGIYLAKESILKGGLSRRSK